MNKTFSNVSKFFNKNSATLCISAGVSGMIGASIFAVAVTPKAQKAIEEKKKELQKRKLSFQEIIKVTWKYYAFPILLEGLSVTCIFVGNEKHKKRNATLATICTASETALSEYKNKVIEKLGEDANKEVQTEIDKEKIKKIDPEIIIADPSAILCYDSLSGREFKSTIEKLRSSENNVNSILLDDGIANLNDFYSDIGLQENSIGEELGWSYNHDKFIRLQFTSHLSQNNIPCLCVNIEPRPRIAYDECF